MNSRAVFVILVVMAQHVYASFPASHLDDKKQRGVDLYAQGCQKALNHCLQSAKDSDAEEACRAYWQNLINIASKKVPTKN